MATIVNLPNTKCGLTFLGSPPCVQSVAPNSPLKGKINIGQYVHGFVAGNEDIVYSGITSANELGRLLVKHREEDRVLVLSSKVANVMNQRMITTITLPNDHRRLGLVFCHGGPPRISDIRVGSPFQNIAAEGMFIHALTVPGVQYRGFASPEELAYRLWQHKGQNPRTLVLSFQPPPQKVEGMMRVTLPTGPINASFKTDLPTVVLDRISDKSPLAFINTISGLQKWKVLALEIPEDEEKKIQIDNLQQKFAIYELRKALRDSENIEGRILTLQRKSLRPTHDIEDEGEAESTVYPSNLDVSHEIHRQSKAFKLFGGHTSLRPETRIGHTFDFFMRTGKRDEDASYYFEDTDGNPLNKNNFRIVRKRANKLSNRTEYWLQELVNGKENPVGLVTESSENGRYGYRIYGCKIRHLFEPFWQQKGMIEREGQKFHPWATVRDSSWKDQIDTREICFYSPDDVNEKW
eukprot:CAMPEP_0178902638 /NCGR_PEP_ID=MMETSP0786-20121207/4716_1 /TAXON_ID=186022 /ORGANISM="Thalassionema frauenfeldii, Strain CCMP 1798" /LENGTH=464 /DNA_ID=CAMNT_0020573927 /DNA_START=115 /DNA_END=1506 /DNA_ORIENTATION=-